MAEVGGGGAIPNGEDLDHVPRDVVHQAHDEGGIGEGLIQLVIGDDESGGEVIEIGGDCTPPVHVGAWEHVKLRNPKGAIVEDLDAASELVLNHLEFGLRIDERVGPRATRIRMAR